MKITYLHIFDCALLPGRNKHSYNINPQVVIVEVVPVIVTSHYTHYAVTLYTTAIIYMYITTR